jgi:hypothetical protein
VPRRSGCLDFSLQQLLFFSPTTFARRRAVRVSASLEPAAAVSDFSSAHKGFALPFFRRFPRAACRRALRPLVGFFVLKPPPPGFSSTGISVSGLETCAPLRRRLRSISAPALGFRHKHANHSPAFARRHAVQRFSEIPPHLGCRGPLRFPESKSRACASISLPLVFESGSSQTPPVLRWFFSVLFRFFSTASPGVHLCFVSHQRLAQRAGRTRPVAAVVSVFALSSDVTPRPVVCAASHQLFSWFNFSSGAVPLLFSVFHPVSAPLLFVCC